MSRILLLSIFLSAVGLAAGCDRSEPRVIDQPPVPAQNLDEFGVEKEVTE